jgi:hypothetical protein
MFQVIVLNVSPVSDIYCSKCFMLQVFSLVDAGTERRRRGSPSVHGKRSGCGRYPHAYAAAGMVAQARASVAASGQHEKQQQQVPMRRSRRRAPAVGAGRCCR